MKPKNLRTLALFLLIFLGITALGGSVGLLMDPSGEGMKLPPEILEGIPFKDYLIPGIVLGVFNGLLSLFFAVLVIRKVRYQGWLVLVQGGILLVWLSAEMVMDLFFAALTIPYLVVGFLLVVFGILMLKR